MRRALCLSDGTPRVCLEKQVPTLGSLFAGIGGIDLGFEWAGFETLWQVEIDPYCQKVLSKRFPHAERLRDIRDCGRHNLKPVDVIAGGFPCQDISLAGKGAGIGGERSGLWCEMHRIIGELRPRFVLVENVAALLGRGIATVLGDLSEIGYDAEWEVISAADVGAPHLRERIWIVAYPNESRPPSERSVGQARATDTDAISPSGEQPGDVADADSAGPAQHREGDAGSERGTGGNTAGDSRGAVGDAAGTRRASGTREPSGTVRQESRRKESDRRSDDVAVTDAERRDGRSHDEGQASSGRRWPESGREAVADSQQQRLEGHAGDGAFDRRWPGPHGSTREARVFRGELCVGEWSVEPNFRGMADGLSQRLDDSVDGSHRDSPTRHQAQVFEDRLRTVWGEITARAAPQGPRSDEQLARELANAMPDMPYAIALDAGQSAVEAAFTFVHRMRLACENDGPMRDTQNSIEEAWQSLPEEEKDRWFLGACGRTDWRSEWPGVPRVAHGIKNRVDRLKGLGNSVVPQIPEMIAWRIAELLQDET